MGHWGSWSSPRFPEKDFFFLPRSWAPVGAAFVTRCRSHDSINNNICHFQAPTGTFLALRLTGQQARPAAAEVAAQSQGLLRDLQSRPALNIPGDQGARGLADGSQRSCFERAEAQDSVFRLMLPGISFSTALLS